MGPEGLSLVTFKKRDKGIQISHNVLSDNNEILRGDIMVKFR